MPTSYGAHLDIGHQVRLGMDRFGLELFALLRCLIAIDREVIVISNNGYILISIKLVVVRIQGLMCLWITLII